MSGTGAPSPVPSGASGGKRKRVTDGAGGEGVVRPPASPLVDKAARTSLVTRPAASGIYSPGADVAGTALAAHTTPTAPSMAGGAVVSGGADGTGVAPEQVHQHIIQRHRQWAAERARHGGAGPGVSPGLHLVFTHPHAPAASAPGVAIEPPPPCTPRDVSGAPVGASPYASAVAGATTPGVPQPAAAPAAHPQQAHATEQAYHGHTAAQPAVGGAPAPAYHHMVPAPAPPPAPVPAPAPAPPLVSARAAARATRSSARVARSTTRGKGSKGGGKGGGGGSGVGAGLDLLDDPMFFIPDGSVGSAWPFSGAWRLDKCVPRCWVAVCVGCGGGGTTHTVHGRCRMRRASRALPHVPCCPTLLAPTPPHTRTTTTQQGELGVHAAALASAGRGQHRCAGG